MEWVRRAEARDVTVGVMGLGYVGLPLARAFVESGVRVIGYDIDQPRVGLLNAGKSYFAHIGDEVVSQMRASGRFEATFEAQRLAEADAILLCVPTPLDSHREPDLSFVRDTTEAVGKVLRRGQLVVLESTTYPGTSSEVLIPILERASGLKVGRDFAVAYSPEREDPGNPHFNTSTIPKVVGADTDAERAIGVALYGLITTPVPVSSLRAAEAVKLTENIYRLVNIALVNELKGVYNNMGIDVWEVIDAAKTKPFGFHAFYPGPGLGGHCIPIDPFYLTWKARAFGLSTRFIELAGDVTNQLPRNVIEAVADGLSDRLSKAINGAKILVMGLAYKKNIDDMRESPSLILIDLLQSRGAKVSYHDPYLPVIPATREHPELAGWESTPLTAENLAQFDCALISTDHDNVDYELLLEQLPLIVDTRNATARYAKTHGCKIVRA
ncbi:UDP-N-acetyl-D-glucosamine dehydrogenase [Caulobacter sp. Root1455]|nr:UDP-N-acetyl-D-glucosamine dehydrogenase [Caulobacter sp. Root487D2Y]KQY93491.1 UDP-N-acetyl-D-glucosamine dehydrogenase [Caulobacter sp. Root1455]